MTVHKWTAPYDWLLVKARRKLRNNDAQWLFVSLLTLAEAHDPETLETLFWREMQANDYLANTMPRWVVSVEGTHTPPPR